MDFTAVTEAGSVRWTHGQRVSCPDLDATLFRYPLQTILQIGIDAA